MLKRIMEKFWKKSKKNTEKAEKICWPCSWDYEQVQNFNAMLYGMALEKTEMK